MRVANCVRKSIPRCDAVLPRLKGSADYRSRERSLLCSVSADHSLPSKTSTMEDLIGTSNQSHNLEAKTSIRFYTHVWNHVGIKFYTHAWKHVGIN
jgi:hypothetical protein